MSLPLATYSGVTRWLRGFIPAFAVGVCILVTLTSTAQAGCGWHVQNLLPESTRASSRHGELVLAMYARYEAGVISFTLQPPSEPCDGLHCRSKPSAAPVSPFLGLTRIQGTWSVGPDAFYDADPFANRVGHGVPTSMFALRGGLSVPEHPPKLG